MEVLNKHLHKIPQESVYCGRPSKWGNPFVIGQKYKGRTLTRNLAIRCFEDWFRYSNEGLKLQGSLYELHDKDLVCFCAPLPCHCEVIVQVYNERYKGEFIKHLYMEG
jgi:hypothetical protein